MDDCTVEPMKHLVVAFSGYSGVGKDECAGRLVKAHGAIHTGLADPAKRHMADVYGFSREQLFGPSHMRNAGDSRYPKTFLRNPDLQFRSVGHGSELDKDPEIIGTVRTDKSYFSIFGRDVPFTESIPGRPGWPALPCIIGRMGFVTYYIEEDHPKFFLSPREALQDYCELMNKMYLETWIRHGIETHKRLAEVELPNGPKFDYRFKFSYDRMTGISKSDPSDSSSYRRWDDPIITCFSDFRHKQEISYSRSAADTYRPVMVRVKSPKIPTPPYQHRSEMEQAEIPDSSFDFVINNDGTLEDLYNKVDEIINVAKLDSWQPLSANTKLEGAK